MMNGDKMETRDEACTSILTSDLCTMQVLCKSRLYGTEYSQYSARISRFLTFLIFLIFLFLLFLMSLAVVCVCFKHFNNMNLR